MIHEGLTSTPIPVTPLCTAEQEKMAEDLENSPMATPAGRRVSVASPRAREFMQELDNKDFGVKDIAMFSGIALLINNITGPGVPGLPNVTLIFTPS